MDKRIGYYLWPFNVDVVALDLDSKELYKRVSDLDKDEIRSLAAVFDKADYKQDEPDSMSIWRVVEDELLEEMWDSTNAVSEELNKQSNGIIYSEFYNGYLYTDELPGDLESANVAVINDKGYLKIQDLKGNLYAIKVVTGDSDIETLAEENPRGEGLDPAKATISESTEKNIKIDKEKIRNITESVVLEYIIKGGIYL